MKIDLVNRKFIGGVKTNAGKDRTVPISDLIFDIVDIKLPLFRKGAHRFREDNFYGVIKRLGINYHTPHDCRHTFSWLCDKYKVDRLSKKLMMGHSIGNDVTDSVYGHRTFEELKHEITKLKHW